MKNWKRLLALFLAGAMALSLCACKSGGSDSDASPSVYADATAGDPSASVSGALDAIPEIVADLSQGVLEFSAGMSADDVALTINGEEVSADLFLYWLDYNCYYFMMNYGMYGYSISDYADDLLEDAAYFCISETLLRQKALELGCLPTDAQVDEAQASLDDDTREMLQSGYGLSDASINSLILSDAYYNNVLAALTHDPDELELEEYLNAQDFYRVKHILLKTVDDSRQPLPDDEIAEKRAQAESLLAELQAAADLPALFDQRMNELSEDGRDGNGDLYAPDGYLTYPGQMDTSFEAASLALEVGGLSELVESAWGYHIILRLPLAPLADDESANYNETFRADALNDLINQWQDEADITKADVLSTLDASDFFNRILVYQQALAEQNAAEDGVG